MSTIRTQRKLAQLINTIALQEKKVETTRQVLCENPNFEAYTAFKRLDINNNGSLSLSEVLIYLDENNIIVTRPESFDFFDSLDLDGDGRISYAEFLAWVLPQENEVLKRRALSREAYYVPPGEPLPSDLEYSLARVFEEELRYFRLRQDDLRDLASSLDFLPAQLFEDLDDNGQGFLDFESVEGFMKELGMVLTASEIDGFFRRIDLDRDGRISYREFLKALEEKSASGSVLRVSPRARSRSPERTSRLSASLRESSLSRVSPRAQLTSSSGFRASVRPPSPSRNLLDIEYKEFLDRSYHRQSQLLESSLRQSQMRASLAVSPRRTSTVLAESILRTSPRSPSRSLAESRVLSASRLTSRSRERSPSRVLLEEEEELQLATVLKEIIECEKTVERAKTDLALRSDFSLMEAFRLFDAGDKEFLTRRDIESGLIRLGVDPGLDDVGLLLLSLGKGITGFLRYSDFCEVIAPRAPEYQRIMTSKAGSISPEVLIEPDLIFTAETRRQFKRLIALILETEGTIERLRARLARRPYFSTSKVFNAIDLDRDGYASLEEIQAFLDRQGFLCTTRDVQTVLNRFDKSERGKVSYSDFLKELVPKSPTRA